MFRNTTTGKLNADAVTHGLLRMINVSREQSRQKTRIRFIFERNGLLDTFGWSYVYNE